MISKTAVAGKKFDVILITGEYYDDHPLSPAGVIARVLDAKGYSIGIIEKPETKEDFQKLGAPRLFFGVTAGSIDSMLNNYTPLKKKREDDKYNKSHKMPDRAVIYYCNKLREYFKDELRKENHDRSENKDRARIVIGGIESSLRRFAHYDYWDNNIRKSILLDSRADILVYGNGEKQIIEIADKIKQKQDIDGISGTAILSKELPSGFELLPKFTEVKKEQSAFGRMQLQFSIEKNLAQEYDNNYVIQYKYPEYTSKDLDWIYSLPFTRKLHPESLLLMAKFSVQTHRGCLGNCNFCSITLHQGRKIISRSEESILEEIKRITAMKDFNGIIEDLGGPSANMYGMDFDAAGKIDLSHKRLITLMRKARELPRIKKVFVRSGIRYDFAMNSKEYIEELSKHHISGCLKIAPEHVTENVLELMNKNTKKLQGFIDYFTSINKESGQHLAYYFMIGHPGDTLDDVRVLKRMMKNLDAESFQLFTPTPMTMSTAMYWTARDLRTGKPIKVVYEYSMKKRMKDIMLDAPMENKPAWNPTGRPIRTPRKTFGAYSRTGAENNRADDEKESKPKGKPKTFNEYNSKYLKTKNRRS